MAELFEITELVKIAVEDEKAGVAFYSRLAEKSEKLEGTFAQLAEEEKFHQKRFEQMLEALGGHAPHEQYPGEYISYLRALTDSRAFPDEQTAERMADECADDIAAVELASRFERDTLILMNEMSSLLPEKHRTIIEDLANEERGHLVTLTEARKQLG